MSLGEHLRTKKALVNMILDMYVKWGDKHAILC